MRCFLSCFALALVLPALCLADEEVVYVACSDDRQVRAFAKGSDGSLGSGPELELPGKPGAMALAPDGARIYVATARREKKRRVEEVVTLRRLPGGRLEVEGAMEVDARATYLQVAPSGRHLLMASYGAGHASVHALVQGVCAERTGRAELERTAHCITLDPSGRFAFVPHTVPNKVYQLRFDAEAGRLEVSEPAAAAGPDTDHDYHGPRHLRFHPTLPMAYSSNELSGGISAWRLDPRAGTLTLAQTLGTLPPGFVGKSTGAEVRLTPDGRFAYVSNRDHGEDRRDTLAGFALDGAGELSAVGHFPTVRFPRAFTVDGTGGFVYVAGQRDGKLASYRVDPRTGALAEIGRRPVGAKPSWVLCAPEPPR